MKKIRPALATIAALALFGALGQANAGVNSRHLVAFSKTNTTTSSDPILFGNNAQSVSKNSTMYVFAQSSAWSIPSIGCKTVAITHADGNIFDINNTGRLVLSGIDVAVVFLDSGNTPIASFFLSSLAPNGTLHTAGYASASSNGELEVYLPNLPGTAASAAFLVEGDVSNIDSSSHSVNSLVSGTIKCD